MVERILIAEGESQDHDDSEHTDGPNAKLTANTFSGNQTLGAADELRIGEAATNLRRLGSGQLITDGGLQAAGRVASGYGTGDLIHLTLTGVIEIGAAGDVNLYRPAANVLATDDTFELAEQASDPAAPPANKARLYARDNGSGKTQLCVRFATGAVQVLATEP